MVGQNVKLNYGDLIFSELEKTIPNTKRTFALIKKAKRDDSKIISH